MKTRRHSVDPTRLPAPPAAPPPKRKPEATGAPATGHTLVSDFTTPTKNRNARMGLNASFQYDLSPVGIARNVRYAQASGAAEVRFNLVVDPATGKLHNTSWDPKHPRASPREVDAAFFKPLFAALQKAGVRPLVTLCVDKADLLSAMYHPDPTWKAPSAAQRAALERQGKPAPKAPLVLGADWQKGMTQLGVAYAKTAARTAAALAKVGVRDIELGNEPNEAVYWPDPNGGNQDRAAQQYMMLLKPAYAAVKQALHGVPDTHVMMAGVSMCNRDYLEALYRHGLAGSTDLINFHPYDMGTTPQAIADSLGGMREVMLRHGDGAKAIWLTELGVTASGKSAPDSAVQAKVLKTIYDNLPPYVERAFWFQAHDFRYADAAGTHEVSYGLDDGAGHAKPAWKAFQAEAAAPPRSLAPGPSAASWMQSTLGHYRQALGPAIGPAHVDGNGEVIQHFQNATVTRGLDGRFAVRSRAGADLTPGDPFAGAHLAHGSALGAALGAVFHEANGNLKQDYANGYALQSPDGRVTLARRDNGQLWRSEPVATPLLDAYRSRRSILGAPRGAAIHEPGGNLKQGFDGGYMLRAADGTLYARRSDNSAI